jgi:hypothetical protein
MQKARYRHQAVNFTELNTAPQDVIYFTYLESGGAPVHELNGPLGFDCGDSGLNILWHDITTVQKAASHYTRVRGRSVNGV